MAKRNATARGATVLRLVPKAPPAPPPVCAQTVNHLVNLLFLAKTGELRGLVYGTDMTGKVCMVNATGSLRRDPIVGRGVAALIDDEMLIRLAEQSSPQALPEWAD